MKSRFVSLIVVLGVSLVVNPAHAGRTCNTLTAPSLTLVSVNCAQAKVWTALRASGEFPDVFFPPEKTTPICYASLGPASALIGQHRVTIISSLSGWTTDFVPGLFGGQDTLGTVVTQLAIVGQPEDYTGKPFTRDTIDLSQIETTGVAPEEDVIVGGSDNLSGAKGTYRVDAMPNDRYATSVSLTNLHGILCTGDE